MPLHHLTVRPANILAALGCILIALLAGMAAGTHVQTNPAATSATIRSGTTQALSEASFWLTLRQRAVIWQPASTDTPFVLQTLDAPGTQIGLLLYGDITPQAWQSVPALADSFHLVWIDTSERLRSALIHASGETVRGPVELATHAGTQLAVVPAPDGSARVFWLSPSNQQITALTLDAEGRPGPSAVFPARDITYFAAAADSDNNTHLIWLTPLEADTWLITYQYLAANSDWATAAATPTTTLTTLTLSPTESITTAAIGLDTSRGYVVIGITDATQPDRERVSTLAFALSDPGNTVYTDILLPTDSTNLPLRWPRPIIGQREDFALAVTAYDQGNWRPAIVYFADGVPTGYDLVTTSSADTPADASPPTLARDTNGDFYLTWAGLDHAEAQRVTLTPTTTGSDTTLARTNLLARSLASLGIGSILSLFWIAAPVLILTLTPPNRWTPPLICTLYSMVKLIWPPKLFRQVPPLLTTSLFEGINAHITVGVTVAIITVIALACAQITRPQHSNRAWLHWLIFALVDGSLTWLIFGPNLISG